ncbi:hypothetical protein L7F22_005946 [Adiantum nelumboides]|nr:hypothetical protein [Adiantum nelumboides]
MGSLSFSHSALQGQQVSPCLQTCEAAFHVPRKLRRRPLVRQLFWVTASHSKSAMRNLNSCVFQAGDPRVLRSKKNRWTCAFAVALETKADTLVFTDEGVRQERTLKRSSVGASSVSSGVKLEHISKSFKGATVLKDVSWEVKKGERVGLVGVNGAGKTTQLKIIAGEEEADSGNLIKAKENMKIAFLTQEFEVVSSRTVREEFSSAFAEQMSVSQRLEEVQKALEASTEDLKLMGKLLDDLDELQKKAQSLNLYDIDVKINKMMPELGFTQEDSERLVASFSGGWQMRMSLGKILLQEPDLLLLDEPTNHLDLATIEWLEGYLKSQDVPMVIVSHDRAFLDQLCTKIVETDLGVSQTYEGNYSAYVLAKAERAEAQRMAWEKQQKEIARTKDIIQRLSGGANTGRASTAGKQLEKIQNEDQIGRPFEHKSIRFRFPEMERSGLVVAEIKKLRKEYDGSVLFDGADLSIERGEKLAIIGPNGCGKSTLLRMLMGMEEPTSGEVQLGEHRVVPNYFEQNQTLANRGVIPGLYGHDDVAVFPALMQSVKSTLASTKLYAGDFRAICFILPCLTLLEHSNWRLENEPDLLDQEYANDTLLFLHYSPDVLDMISYALEVFCVANCARINWDKFYGILAGSDDVLTWGLDDVLTWGLGDFTWLRPGVTCRYLGFQVGFDVSREQQFSPVMQSMRRKLCYWSSQHLSMAGRALVANQAEVLDLSKTVLQTVVDAAEEWSLNDIKGLLGRCNFKAEMLERNVSFLSGGEKARLAFCKFMVTPSTFLVLDEPTNHLDIPSKEMLEEAIREYRGTVVAVSHDRYFLKQIVNRVVEVKNKKLQNYDGDYNYYLEQNLEARRLELERNKELDAKAPGVKAKSKMSKAEKELQKKQKAQAFQAGKAKGKITKNAKRWN